MKFSRKYLPLVSLVCFGCIKDTCLEKAGAILTTEKNITSIDSINIDNNIDLVLIQSTENKVVTETGENLHSYISTDLTGKTLTIKNNVKCNFIRNPNETITVYVYLTGIKYLHYSGYGDVRCVNQIIAKDFVYVGDGVGTVQLNLDANNTIISNYGSSDVFMKGKSDYCKAYTGFRGTLNFKEFIVKNLEIDFESVFDGYINVSESLKGTINYKGNLYYSGNPSSINITMNNSGKLIRL